MIKVSSLAVLLIKRAIEMQISLRNKKAPSLDLYEHKLEIPYKNDDNLYHTYDVFYAKENRKNCLIIDIHGGSYILSTNIDNYPYAAVFLKAGFDVITVDYEPNDGKKDIYDQANDCAICITHIKNHLNELGLDKDDIVVAGDSAGGHLALLMAMAMNNASSATNMNLSLPYLNPKALILSSPVYDFENLAKGSLTNKAAKRLFGPRYTDKEHILSLSPKTYMNDFTIPVFLSTCKNDFLRSESLKLNEDMKLKDNIYEFCDIKSSRLEIDHVHNVTKPNLRQSIEVNAKAIDFIDKILANS